MTMDELRARHVEAPDHRCVQDADVWPCDFIRADDDRRRLLAEYQHVLAMLDDAAAERDAARIENGRLLAVVEAARRASDKRTLMDDGFWISKREMRYIDDALAALDEVQP